MLYLAQVQENPSSGEIELKLLARQKDQLNWEVNAWGSLSPDKSQFLSIGTLVLVEYQEERIISVKEATEWVLNLLTKCQNREAIAALLLEEERSKVEQWRQEITAEKLEISRQLLEIQTHTEQLQELEQALKQDQKKLEEEQEKL